MRVLIAGATGAIGRPLSRMLHEGGDEPVAMIHRTAADAGLRSVRADALDRNAVLAAVTEVAPDAIVNLLTAIPPAPNPRRLAAEFALTNRLRSEGTANLVAAAPPGTRIISEGVAFAYAPGGGGPADEDQGLWFDGPGGFGVVVAALAELERLTLGAEGLVLRFGHLYGPGTLFAADGFVADQLRARRMPIVGDGSGQFSFIHVLDAARAIVAALRQPEITGALNIVDDTPVATRVWLPEFAAAVGAPAPRRVPEWLARLAGGAWAAAYLNGLVGARNARARRVLGWAPQYPALADGLAAEG